jgi:hypothetical protein
MAHGILASARKRLRGLLVGCAAVVLVATPAFAQSQSSSAPPDFLLGRPRATVGIKGSWFMPSAGSDFYDTVTDTLTLEKSNFRTGTFSAELGVSVTPRLDITAGVDLNNVNAASEDRENEELLANGSRVPIQQVTELSQMNFTASAKFALLPRGRSVSRLAWIPRTIVPYVGAGGGIGKYNLQQNGDFVDYIDNHIFSDTFRSSDWAPLAQVFGGTDVQVHRRVILSFEGRYTWQKGDLDPDFVNFEPIDLGGLRFGAGIHFAF